MASIRDIARQTGVSITTVSRALNNQPQVSPEVRRRVLAAVNKSRYVPNVGRRSTTNIAFVYTGQLSLGSPFDAALLQGMSNGLERAGLDLMILNADRALMEGENYTQMFLRKGVRGAIIRTTAQTRETCLKIAAEGFPAVVVADQFDESGVSFVRSASYAASVKAVEHLLTLGHRRIAIAANMLDDHDHLERINAYRDTLTKAGIEVDERLVIRAWATVPGGSMVLRQILSASQSRPTALVVADPMLCVGLYMEAQKSNIKIPNDLSIVGFDDGEVRHTLYPHMTSVCQNAEGLGGQALATLVQMLSDPKNLEFKRTFECWLEVHSSTMSVEK